MPPVGEFRTTVTSGIMNTSLGYKHIILISCFVAGVVAEIDRVFGT